MSPTAVRRRRTIPAVTLWRPWASCFIDLPPQWAKRRENRGWATKYRGLIYLHAGKRFDFDAVGTADDAMTQLADTPIDLTFLTRKGDHPTGIVGIANLVDVCSAQAGSTTNGATCDCGPWAFPGQHHWRFSHVVGLAPVEHNGAQNLWDPDAAADAAALAQLATLDVCRRCLAPATGRCCSTHGHRLCHGCYRRTHFVEVCVEGCPDCAAEGLPLAFPHVIGPRVGTSR